MKYCQEHIPAKLIRELARQMSQEGWESSPATLAGTGLPRKVLCESRVRGSCTHQTRFQTKNPTLFTFTMHLKLKLVFVLQGIFQSFVQY